MNIAYYAPTIPVNLFSLGHLQRCGASYGPDPLRPLTHFAVHSSPSGPLLAYAALSSNNLLLVDFDALNKASTMSPLQYHPSYALNATFPIHHINAEQRARADAAEQLHIDLCHPSDRSLCSNLCLSAHSHARTLHSTASSAVLAHIAPLANTPTHHILHLPVPLPLPLGRSSHSTHNSFQSLHRANTHTRSSSWMSLQVISLSLAQRPKQPQLCLNPYNTS
jgi:hypothetical protein